MPFASAVNQVPPGPNNSNTDYVVWHLTRLMITAGWTVYGSSNGSSFNTSGTDLWSTFAGTGLSGSNAWIALVEQGNTGQGIVFQKNSSLVDGNKRTYRTITGFSPSGASTSVAPQGVSGTFYVEGSSTDGTYQWLRDRPQQYGNPSGGTYLIGTAPVLRYHLVVQNTAAGDFSFWAGCHSFGGGANPGDAQATNTAMDGLLMMTKLDNYGPIDGTTGDPYATLARNVNTGWNIGNGYQNIGGNYVLQPGTPSWSIQGNQSRWRVVSPSNTYVPALVGQMVHVDYTGGGIVHPQNQINSYAGGSPRLIQKPYMFALPTPGTYHPKGFARWFGIIDPAGLGANTFLDNYKWVWISQTRSVSYPTTESIDQSITLPWDGATTSFLRT